MLMITKNVNGYLMMVVEVWQIIFNFQKYSHMQLGAKYVVFRNCHLVLPTRTVLHYGQW